MSAQELATAMANIATLLQQIQQQQANPAPPVAPVAPVHNPVFDIFDATTAFDLSSRAGSAAFAQASAPLQDKWNGTIDTFPSFMMSLRVRSQKAKWNAAAPHGILTYDVQGTNRHLLTEYYDIPAPILETARTNRIDPRAIQNSLAFYTCLKDSIEGDLRATMFDQFGNLPEFEDGPLLLKKFTSFTMASTLQLSMQSFVQIQNLDPADYAFNISTVNTKMTHLFLLATTGQRRISEAEKIQHLLTAYTKIRQPEVWAQWVRGRVDAFDEGQITNSQAFMNSAALKYIKLSSSEEGFAARSTTVQDDVIALLAPKTKPSKNHQSDALPDKSTKQPPFLTHYKTSLSPDAPKFTLGDTKVFEGVTYHFCDCPKHRDKIKWHQHPPDQCRTRQRWLANGGGSAPPPIANVGDDSPTANSPLTNPSAPPSLATPTPAPPPAQTSDVTALLADALQLMSDNPIARDLIADALNAVHDV